MDVILEMLRRHTVKGGVGRIVDYHGPGLAHLSAMDRSSRQERVYTKRAAMVASAWVRLLPRTGSALAPCLGTSRGALGRGEDGVYLVSPETAAASALAGTITDPRTLDMPFPRIQDPIEYSVNTRMLTPPLMLAEAWKVELVRGPNIAKLPALDPLPETIEVPVLLRIGDDISTDETLRAGGEVLPYRSNIPKISEFAFDRIHRT